MTQDHLPITAEPIFVLGAPRSGTSMIQWALRQHPDLWGGPESDFFIPLFEGTRQAHSHGTERGRLHWLSRLEVDEHELVSYVAAGVNALYTQRSGGKRWVEQTPQYTLHLDLMADAFPGAQFVYMLRSGREVVRSLRHFTNPVAHGEACRIWAAFAQAGLDFAEGPRGDRMKVVRYADAVERTPATLSDLLTALGLPSDDACSRFITEGDRINSSFDGDKVERPWSALEERQFKGRCGELMERLGL